jgi:hypothetical protein
MAAVRAKLIQHEALNYDKVEAPIFFKKMRLKYVFMYMELCRYIVGEIMQLH